MTVKGKNYWQKIFPNDLRGTLQNVTNYLDKKRPLDSDKF